MTDDFHYFEYLRQRSRLGDIYRRLWLYPRVTRSLRGHTLDVGCGIGDMLAFRRNTVGVDINQRTVDYCRGLGLQAELMEPDRLPFPDASFDSCLLDNVLEHVEAPQALLAEVRRVLKLGGRLVVGVPGVRGWESDPDHKVFYNEVLLVERLCKSGFSLSGIFYTPLFRSNWLDHNLRQYCVYGAFDLAHP